MWKNTSEFWTGNLSLMQSRLFSVNVIVIDKQQAIISFKDDPVTDLHAGRHAGDS